MRLLVATAAVSLLSVSAPAFADSTITVNFSGIVDDGSNTDSPPVNTTYTPGQTITGSFVFDATTDTFNAFSIGGYTLAPGFATNNSPSLLSTPYAFLGVETLDSNSVPTSLLQINFYYEGTPVSTQNIAAFIMNPGAFSQDIAGGDASYFAVDLTNSDGSNTQVDGLLTSYTQVPEPASLVLIFPALAGFGLLRRRTR